MELWFGKYVSLLLKELRLHRISFALAATFCFAFLFLLQHPSAEHNGLLTSSCLIPLV